MKHTMKKNISYLFLLLAITWGGCKKDYLELAVNPNSPVAVTPQLLLSGGLKITADILNGNKTSTGGVTNAGYTMYAAWMGYVNWSTGYQPNVSLLQYAFTNGDYDVWSRLYLNLANYNALSKSTSEPYFLAISKIMTVVDYQQLVDNYNNVPYTTTFQGTVNLNPTYDKGTVIYDDLMKQLDAAIVTINNAPASAINPGTSDIMYKGDMTKWLKYANTLKLRLAIRQSNITSKAAALKTAVAATSTIGYLDASNPATVNPGYANVDANGGQQSPLYGTYGYTQSGGTQSYNVQYMANQTAIDYYTSTNDPRLLQVYAKNANGQLVGLYLGQVVTSPAGLLPSRFGPGVLKSPTMNAVIMSGAESLFLQAEAASTGLIAGTAETFYKAGIKASFADDLVTITDDAFNTYYAQATVAYPTGGTAAAQQKAIIVQKWAALNPYGALEAYNEYRRTGYPDYNFLSRYSGANAPNQVTRIYYPAVEYQTNATNVGAEGPINIFTSKIFWAK